MQLYTKYLFKKLLSPLAFSSLMIIVLIWITQSMNLISYITDFGLETSKFFYISVLILPALLLTITPIIIFFTALIVYNQFITNNEIAVLESAGISKLSLFRPILMTSILVSLLCYGISLYLMPKANRELRLIKNDIINNYSSIAVSDGVFNNLKDITLYVREQKRDGRLTGIVLYDNKKDDDTTLVTAKSGIIDNRGDGVFLELKDGSIQKMDKNNNPVILHFSDYAINLSNYQKQSNDPKIWKANTRFLNELINPYKTYPNIGEKKAKKFIAEAHKRITMPILPIIMSLIAVTAILFGNFSRRGRKKNIIASTVIAGVFMGLTVTIYNMIEANPAAAPILYSFLLACSAACLYFLSEINLLSFIKSLAIKSKKR